MISAPDSADGCLAQAKRHGDRLPAHSLAKHGCDFPCHSLIDDCCVVAHSAWGPVPTGVHLMPCVFLPGAPLKILYSVVSSVEVFVVSLFAAPAPPSERSEHEAMDEMKRWVPITREDDSLIPPLRAWSKYPLSLRDSLPVAPFYYPCNAFDASKARNHVAPREAANPLPLFFHDRIIT